MSPIKDILLNETLYNELIDLLPDVERKGKTMPYTSVNGHMFSFLTNDGSMGLRLPANERKEFIQKFNTGLMQQHGSVMREYVDVPGSMLGDKDKLVAYLNKSYEYVAGLKPKK